MPSVPIQPVDWSQIKNYSPSQFKYPYLLEDSVVSGLDALADKLPRSPIVIDDFRLQSDNPKSQHKLGRAIDFIVPGVDWSDVLAAIKDTAAFSGYGIYTNEKGALSYHVDTRTDRSPENPATWGAWKDRTANVFSWQYVGLSDIIGKLPGDRAIATLVIAGLLIWWLLSKIKT